MDKYELLKNACEELLIDLRDPRTGDLFENATEWERCGSRSATRIFNMFHKLHFIRRLLGGES